MTKKILLGCVALTTAALAGGFALDDHWGMALFSLVSGMVWVVLAYLGRGYPAIPLVVSTGLIVTAGLMIRASVLPIVAMVATLSAWDLSLFEKRLQYTIQSEATTLLERNHLLRLLVVDGIGLLISLPALTVRIHFGFAILFFASLALFLVLYRIVILLATGDKRL